MWLAIWSAWGAPASAPALAPSSLRPGSRSNSWCLGLFAAARVLNLGHVAGAPLHIYIDDFRPERLPDAGLSESPAGHPASVMLRVPSARESVFRGVVKVHDLGVSDVLQTWLDTGAHPARGKEQAELIYRHVIKPMVREANARTR